MAKRIVSGILGAIAAFGSLLPLLYAFEIFKDFGNPDISFWPSVLGALLMCSIAIAGLWIGIRFLRFALSGESKPDNSLAKPILLGIGFFFPGFLFSLPVTLLWADRSWLLCSRQSGHVLGQLSRRIPLDCEFPRLPGIESVLAGVNGS
jgi:hypothetical protein